MNIDRGKESFTDAEIQELRVQLKAYKDYGDLSWTDLHKATGVGATTLSAFVNNTYKGDNAGIAWAVNRFFLAEEARQELELKAPIVPPYQVTPTSRQMMAQLQFARRGKLVVIAGNPGVGKTATFDQFCSQTPNAFKATMDPANRSLTSMLQAVLKSCGSTSKYGGRAFNLVEAICDRLDGMTAVIIVDEAQLLDDDSVEQLRAIHDRLKCGLCLAGNPEIMKRVQRGAKTAAFAQIHSRVAWPAYYGNPTAADLDVIIRAWGIEKPAQDKFLRTIALQSGGLRTIAQVMEMATLTARATDEDVTLSHIKAAYQQRQLTHQAA